MATEKILIDSLKSSLTALPGGITVYDSTGSSKRLKKPTLFPDLEKQTIQSVSKKDLEGQGIRVISKSNGAIGVQFVYPKNQQSLLSFVGTLPAYTYIFTNPSEDPKKHRVELTSEVFQTTSDIDFTAEEPTQFQVLGVFTNTSQEISRLGHFISLQQQSQPNKSQFPPDDLRLFLPPVHIPSQHLGDCAADTIQTALFFADGFQEIFAELANTLYKKYIRTEPLVVLGVDNPTLIEEVRKAFSVPPTISQQEQDAITVFASMIRRFILVRLLDFGTEEEIAALKIPPTTCLLPGAVPPMGIVRGRRKSLNLLSGATLARKISRIFEPSSLIGPDLKLKPTEITLQLEHDFFCLLFRLTQQAMMHSFIFERVKPIPVETSTIRAILYPLILTQKNQGAQSLEEGGHSISLFRFQDQWYLQDDNIGIAKPLPKFDLEHYIQGKSEFFITSFSFLQNKSDLIEQGFFRQEEFRAGIPRGYVYYGYRYTTSSGLQKEKILHKDTLSYNGRFDAGGASLFLCIGEISEDQKKKAVLRCAPVEKVVQAKEVKVIPKGKILPPELLAQMNIPTTNTGKPKQATGPIAALQRNIQANLNAFNSTRKQNLSTVSKNTRKVRSYTNTKILTQFTGF